MKVIAVFLLAFVGITLANTIPHPLEKTWARNRLGGRVVGGQETTIEKHPWQVAMIRSGSFYCGGAIIGERWVVSAAHCVADKPDPKVVQLRAGSSDRAESGVLANVDFIEVHPLYGTQNYAYDVALLRLTERLVWSDKIQAIALPSIDWEPEVGSDVTVSGWGRAGISSGLLSPRIIRDVTVPVISREDCSVAWPGSVDETMVCAGRPGADACNGDSGGPLNQDGKILVGVVSWGSIFCEDASPGAYARLSEPVIWGWINETVHQ